MTFAEFACLSRQRWSARLSLVLIASAMFANGQNGIKTASHIGLNNGWQIQSACKLKAKGETISTAAYRPAGWIKAQVPGTVFGSLVTAKIDKHFQDPFYGKNLLDIPGMNYERGSIFSRDPMPADSPYQCTWWYRTEVIIPAADRGRNFWLNFGGINYRANIWMNGHQLAKSDDVAGAYRTYEFDVTSQVRPGEQNVVAVEVTAPTPGDLAINWVDWNPAPADKDMGIWREVYLSTSGRVTLRNPQVVSKVNAETLDSAEITVSTEVSNTLPEPVEGVLEGRVGTISFTQPVKLDAHETRVVFFKPEEFSQLKLAHPELWWPLQMGKPTLQTLDLQFKVQGRTSDQQSVRFGIREVTSELTPEGHRLIRINGKPILIRGGGWAPDMMLRTNAERLKKEFAYVKHLGLNTVRLEGKLESDEFYDLADQEGILVMAGWCCCDIWEGWDKWTPETKKVAVESLRSQALRMRNHPSIFAWLNGSDNPPTAEIESTYQQVLKDLNWPNVVLSSATDQKTTVSGASGVKMTGPYEWVPPSYWYVDHTKFGGAFGFITETSPGPAIPTLESLHRFVPADQLWPLGDGLLYHAGQTRFAQLSVMTNGMNDRYGKATDLEDYINKSQAIAYEGQRAMFEAYSHNKYTSTGVVQWMLNNAWPSIIWHLYDYYLDPAAGYFGTRKANEPLHAIYAYDDHSIYAVNSTYQVANHLTLKTTVLNFDLTPKFQSSTPVDLAADEAKKVLALPDIADLSTTYFVKLQLEDAQGKTVSNNFYWLSTSPETFNWAMTDFTHTPTQTLANGDLKQLNSLSKVKLVLGTTGSHRVGTEESTIVSIKNPSTHLAFMIHLRLLKAEPGRPAWCNATSYDAGECSPEDILPILWDDNYFSLLPGEERTIKATYSAANLGKGAPVLVVGGWNIDAAKLPLATMPQH